MVEFEVCDSADAFQECTNPLRESALSTLSDESLLALERAAYHVTVLSNYLENNPRQHEVPAARENTPYTIVEVPVIGGGTRYVFNEHPGPGFDNW